MSGGQFDYVQYKFEETAEQIERIIARNNKEDEFGYKTDFEEITIREFKKAAQIIKDAAVYVQRIDWLVSGDDGEESFHERLKKELSQPPAAKE